MSIPRGRYSFHSHAAPLAQITNEGLTATRKDPLRIFFKAVLIGAQPLQDGKMFEVRIEKTVDKWVRSIIIGCTTCRPESVLLPETLCGLKPSVGFVQHSWIYLNSSMLVKHRLNPGTPLRYGGDIESLDIGDTVGIARVGRKLKFYINGSDQGTAEDNLPPVVYPMVDVYARCTQVSIVSPGKLP